MIDEMGGMECLNRIFIAVTEGAMEGPVSALATVAARGGGFITLVKKRPEVQLMAVAAENREQLPNLLSNLLTSEP